ncbi:uncharacterized protein [Argopecten irradians]|uniref:uncharacterized protein n=1 Tax=Argopecten irradians TaxID=31199 RepID=UPI003715A9E5
MAKAFLLIVVIGVVHSAEVHSGQIDIGNGVLEPISVKYDEKSHVTVITHYGSDGNTVLVSDGTTGEFIIKDVGIHRCLVGKATSDMIRQLDVVSSALLTHAIAHMPDNTYTFVPTPGMTVGSVAHSECEGAALTTGYFTNGSQVTHTRKYWCWGLSFGRTCVGVGGAR